MAEIKVYGAPWCPDCRRAKKFLGEHRVAYDWIDIEANDADRRFVEELQNGVSDLEVGPGDQALDPGVPALGEIVGR